MEKPFCILLRLLLWTSSQASGSSPGSITVSSCVYASIPLKETLDAAGEDHEVVMSEKEAGLPG